MCLAVNANDTNNDNPNGVNFTIKDTKLYVPFLILSTKSNHKLSKFLRKGFEKLSKYLHKKLEKSVYWNEYEGKCDNKDTKNEYRCFLETSFVEVNWLFVLVYLDRDNDIERYSA